MDEEPTSGDELFSVSDDALREATGRGREEWFSLLDGWGAAERAHAPIAAWVAREHSVDAWWAQTITVDYERARGLRPKGGHRDGTHDANASRTIAVAVGQLYDAIVDPARRALWLPDSDLRERAVQSDRSARFDWGDDGTRVHFYLTGKGEGKSQVSMQHVRLPDAARAEEMKEFWRARLSDLKALLEE